MQFKSIRDQAGYIVMMSRQAGKNELSAQPRKPLLLTRHAYSGGNIVKAQPTFPPKVSTHRDAAAPGDRKGVKRELGTCSAMGGLTSFYGVPNGERGWCYWGWLTVKADCVPKRSIIKTSGQWVPPPM